MAPADFQGHMPILVPVAVVLAIPAAWFVFSLLRNGPRAQHFLFAQELLPAHLFETPDALCEQLLKPVPDPAGRNILLGIWKQALAEGEETISSDELSYTCESVGNDSMACLVHLPAPTKELESFFAAIVFQNVSQSSKCLKSFRYFLLEYHGEKAGKIQTRVVECVRKPSGSIKPVEVAEDINPESPAFLKFLRELLAASTAPELSGKPREAFAGA
jgi:hypothetical protein